MKNINRNLMAGVCAFLVTTFIFANRRETSKAEEKPPARGSAQYDPALYKAMQWREIGPFRGGRSLAVAGHPNQKLTYYLGTTGGGVWKTEDGGTTWRNVTDGFIKSGAVGAIAVAESDPNVIYVGTGEGCIRNTIISGDGVYKSTDAGRTWKPVGLTDTRFIGSVRIHPHDPDLVYVAALGHAFGPNPERGVYRSKNGGVTWEKILYKNDKTGAIDLSLDPTNPRIIYAALWEAYRNPWSLSSGGSGSGLHKSTDGGDNWVELTNNPGIPKGVKGRIGVAASPAKADRIWALVEAEEGGLFRSDDGGKTWTKVNSDHRLSQRAWYYSHIFADPKNAEALYVLNVPFLKSIDGGKTFTIIRAPHGDNHALWIDPTDPQRMINGNDGGGAISYNGGETWSRQDQPTAQFYHVSVDNRTPYHVYGAQQDNSTIGIASRTNHGAIDRPDWYMVGGGESGYVVADPRNPNLVYAGSYGGYLTRYDHRTGEIKNISVWPETTIGSGAAPLKYRFQWTNPIVISPHDPSVIYFTGNHVFKSRNEGMSWEPISPDLTRNDKTKMESSGGPITKDNTSAEYYGTIFTLAESPVQKGVLWAGSDDGLIQISRDDGRNWQNVTPKSLPEWALISLIEASPHDAAKAYVAATRYKLDDYKPYVYKTEDSGKSWKLITQGIPNETIVRAVREDPVRKGLLYAGTEQGVFVSFNDGGSWQSLQLNLPLIPVHDLVIHPRDHDLVAATHGRSFWILDDVTPLRQITEQVAQSDLHLFEPRPTSRARAEGRFMRGQTAVGKNPPLGVLIYYSSKTKPEGETKLEILNEQDQVIQSFSSKQEKRSEEANQEDEEESMGPRPAVRRLTAEAGMNRFVWDLRYADAKRVPGAVMRGGSLRGPIALPGKYRVRLIAGDKKLEQPLTISSDPRLEVASADLKEQFDFLIQIRDKLSQANQAVRDIRTVRQQVEDLLQKLDGNAAKPDITKAGNSLKTRLSDVEEGIIQVKIKSSHDVLNYPVKLNNKLAALASAVDSTDSKPTKQSRDVFDKLSAELETYLAKLKDVEASDLASFNRLVREKDIPFVSIKPLEGE